MQIFDAASTDKIAGIRQQIYLTAKFRPILAVFSTPKKTVCKLSFEIILIFFKNKYFDKFSTKLPLYSLNILPRSYIMKYLNFVIFTSSIWHVEKATYHIILEGIYNIRKKLPFSETGQFTHVP